MKDLKIDKDFIFEKIDLIRISLKKLQGLQGLTPGQFALDKNFAVAEHYLRYALEAMLDICGHILSRMPGAKIEEYKQMALEMGKQKIVPMEFAEKKLEKMAGYRNRLTHFYFEVTPQEMYDIIQNHLGDFDTFLDHIKKLL